MAPPAQNLDLDITAISGICGSISIACWTAVYSPQIVKNFQRASTEGLSLQFITVWFAGDVFNVIGAVLQGVLPTMVILGIYYTLCDIVLLAQFFYYSRSTSRSEAIAKTNDARDSQIGEPNEHTGLLTPNGALERRRNDISVTHLSPAVPMIDSNTKPAPSSKPATFLQSLIWNLFSVIIVCFAGIAGWYLSDRHHGHDRSSPVIHPHDDPVLHFSLLGQIFGYFCTAFYLGSRVPQMLLNYRRKSTEGISMLFFMFACVGNLSYVLSIFAYDPARHCAGKVCGDGEENRVYARYIAVNASWLIGSLGTLMLDFGIFLQFFLYDAQVEGTEEPERNVVPRDQRPLLERGDLEVV